MRPHLAVIWLLTRMRPHVYSQAAKLEERPFARVAGMRRACGVSRQCACKYAVTRGATGYNMVLQHTATRRPSAPMGGCIVQQATAWSVARTLINSCSARTPVDSCSVWRLKWSRPTPTSSVAERVVARPTRLPSRQQRAPRSSALCLRAKASCRRATRRGGGHPPGYLRHNDPQFSDGFRGR